MPTVEPESIPWTLPPDLAERGPGVIGATGGSGTRVLARIVRSAGMFIGDDLNAYEDALPFGAYSDRWIDGYVASRSASEPVRAAMLADLEELVTVHCASIGEAPRWGWKEPRSIYLLPFYARAMPTLRFVHFVRDGRDMAFSDNQQQLKKHGRAVLGSRASRFRRPLRSIALWARVNLEAADYGERELGERYLRIRFEDLCAEPGPTVAAILDFFDLEGDGDALGKAEVRPPKTLGRWREERPRTVHALEEIAEPALTRFGYR